MLQIHNILENFPKETTQELFATKKSLELFDGPCFDFGQLKTKLSDDKTFLGLVDYAYELAQEDQFKFADESVSYCWEEGDNSLVNCLCANYSKNIFSTFIFFARKKPFKLMSVGMVIVKDFGKLPKQNGHVCTESRNIILWSANGPMSGKDQDFYFKGMVLRIIALTAMQKAKHFRTRTTAIGDRLNKKREKRGLPKIMPFHTVYFDVEGKEYSAEGTPKGPGAQKRMHWRRGHFRRLSTGKTIHVRPCLINAFELDVKIEKPLYKIREKEPVA